MTDPSTSSRWVPPAVAALIVLATAHGGVSAVATATSLVLLLLAGATAILAARRRSPLSAPRNAVLGIVSGVLAVPASLSLADRLAPGSLVGQLAFVLALPISTVLVVAAPFARRPSDRRMRLVTVAFVLVASSLSALALGPLGRRIDVYVFLTQGVGALLRGENPYTTVFPNIYTPQESLRPPEVGVGWLLRFMPA
ncbi:MAG: hypothetical protein ABJA74_09420 [Lapillicoccus sp.]